MNNSNTKGTPCHLLHLSHQISSDTYLNEISNDEELDNTWINKYKLENLDELYSEPVKNINLYYLYVNKHNELVNIKKDTTFLEEENIVSKDELIMLIKNYQLKNYRFFSILKFNIDLHEEELDDFIKEKNINRNINTNNTNQQISTYYRFLNEEKNLNVITFNNSLNLFQDLNSLYFIFHEKKVVNKNIYKTKHRKINVNNLNKRYTRRK